MPVTVYPAEHDASPLRLDGRWVVRNAQELLEGPGGIETRECEEVLQSSFSRDSSRPTFASTNGFVRGAIMAYNDHHHLRIRPEDVWFSILSQINFFINARSEEMRSKFVAHDGKKELIKVYMADRYTMDFGMFARDITELIEQNVLDPELREWFTPNFSTTTMNDHIISAILLMSSTQHYFNFTCALKCGLPSVTLLGERGDWELILQRLEKLKTFGEEPAIFYRLLQPVITRFIRSFDEPTAQETIDFWQRIAHHEEGGSGPSYYSGWITAFCFWNSKGKRLWSPGRCLLEQDYELVLYDDCSQQSRDEDPDWDPYSLKSEEELGNYLLELDDAKYHRIETTDVPPGCATVPVKVIDNGIEFPAVMVAGSVGIASSRSDMCESELDTIQAESAWFVYEKRC